MNLRERFEKENPIKIVKDGDRLKIRADVHFIRESKYAKWLEALIKSQADELENDSKCYNTMIKVKNDLQAELASLQNRIDEAPKETRSRVFASVNMGVLDEEVYTVALLEIKEEQVKK